MSRNRLPLGAAAVTIVMWASAFVVIRDVAQEIHPAALTLGRLLVGAAALWLVSGRVRGIAGTIRGRPPRRDFLGIAATGVVGFAGYGVSLAAGERTVDAGTASLIVNTVPLWVALLGFLLLKEPIRGQLAVGLVVGYAGAALLIVGEASGSVATGPGVAFVIAAALFQATHFVLQRPLIERRGALETNLWSMTLAILVLLPATPALISAMDGSPLRLGTAVAYLGLGPTALGFSLWSYALRHGSTAAHTTTLLYAVPGVAIIVAWVFLGERPTLITLTGGCVALAGIVIARRPRSSE